MEHHCKKYPFSDQTFSVYAPKTGTGLPVLLFQSGYGCSTDTHAALLRKIASAGIVVVTCNREGDKVCFYHPLAARESTHSTDRDRDRQTDRQTYRQTDR